MQLNIRVKNRNLASKKAHAPILESLGRMNSIPFIAHVTSSSVVTKEIDPLAMTAEESLFLGMLLDEQVCSHEQYFFKKGCNIVELKYPHPLAQKNITVELNLKYPLLWRECEGDHQDHRYEIIGEKLGFGGFSTVYKSKGVLAPQIDGSLFLKNSNRVIKVQHHSDDYPVDYALNEYDNGKLTPHIHCKKPILINNDELSFSVIRYFSGDELFSLLGKDRHDDLFNTDQRLLLSLRILQALRDQIQTRGLVHKDIKPENLIIFMENKDFVVNTIDLGSSKQRNKPDSLDTAITPPYAAPESYEKTGTNEATDVYSTARVLGLLWRSKASDIWKSDQDSTIDFEKAYDDSLSYQFEKIFRGIELEDKYRNEIKILLIKMSEYDKNQRYSLDDAIEVFERIIAERQLTSPVKMHNQVVLRAHTKAVELRRMMSDDVKDPFFMASQINSVLAELADDPVANNEFITTLGIRALQGLQTHADIKKELSAIIMTHTEYLEQLNGFLKDVNGLISQIQFLQPADQTLEDWAQTQCAAINHRKNSIFMVTIDDMVASNQRLFKFLNNTALRIDYLKSEVERVVCKNSNQASSSSWLPQNSIFNKKREQDVTVVLNGKVLDPVHSATPALLMLR